MEMIEKALIGLTSTKDNLMKKWCAGVLERLINKILSN